MFVKINLLTIMKIGIIGADKLAHLVANLIKNIEGLEMTGCYHCDYSLSMEFATYHKIVPYPTLEAFLKNVDAIVINLNTNNAMLLIETCLKCFKHVFVTEAQQLGYKNYLRLEKIAEESNVRLYSEFGLDHGFILEDIAKRSNDLLFINASHTYAMNEGICMRGLLPSFILQDINIILRLIKANVKKINANCWSFNQPGAGMLSAKLDFDNGTSCNLLLVNSGNYEERHMTLYYKTEIIQIDFIENYIKVTSNSDYTDGRQKTIKYALTPENSLMHEIKLFQLSVQNNLSALRSADDKYKSIKVSHLIEEKINHFTSSHIFYS